MISSERGHSRLMKTLSFALTSMGLALLTFIIWTGSQHTLDAWHIAPTLYTWTATAIGALSLIVVWVQPQLAMFLLFGASIAGIPSWLAVWAGPGSFFLSAALLLLTTISQSKPPRAP